MKAMNLINAIFDKIIELNLSGSEQLVLLHLYNLFNRAHWTESIQVTDKSLLALLNQRDHTGQNISCETLRRAKQRLKQLGLIGFDSGGGKNATTYQIAPFARLDTPVDGVEGAGEGLLAENSISSNNLLEDVKTLRRKKRAGAYASYFPELELDIESLGELLDFWEEEYGLPELQLRGLRRLSDLQKKYGTAEVKTAIGKAYDRFLQRTGIEAVEGFLEKSKSDKKGEEEYESSW